MIHSHCQRLKKIIAVMVMGVFLLHVSMVSDLPAQSVDEINKQFRIARDQYNNGQYVNAMARIERVISLSLKNEALKNVLGQCYLLMGAIYEKQGKPILAEENYCKARDTYHITSVESVDLSSLELYRKFIPVEKVLPKGTIEKPGIKKERKFPWLLVAVGVVVVGAVVYFLFLKPKKKYQLTVEVEEGVTGNPQRGTYSYKKGSTVEYNYTALSGYSQLVVELDGRGIESSGSFKVTGNHFLRARAQANDVRILTDKKELKIPENGSATFNVWLSAQPPKDILIEVSKISGDIDISINPDHTNLTYTPSNYNEPQEVELRAADDLDLDNESATILLSSPDIADEKTIIAEEIDNDTLALVISPTNLSVPEGGTEDFQVKLSAKPNFNVIVTTTFKSGDSSIYVKSGSPLLFTPADYNTPLSVILEALDDADTDNGKAFFEVTASGNNIESKIITAEEIDKDNLNFITDTNRVLVPEGGTAQFTVQLSAQPSSEVTAAVSLESGDPDITVDPETLTFNESNWSTPQTVTLAAARDNDEENGTATISISAADIETKRITAEEVDNYSPGFETDKNELIIIEGQSGEFRVKLSDQPTSDIIANITLSGHSYIQLQSEPTLTFTPNDWGTYQTITLKAEPDMNALNDQAVVTISANGLPSKQIPVKEHDIEGDAEPLIKIEEPKNGDRIDKDVTIRGKASDMDGGINKIELYIDVELVQTFYANTFEYTWSTRIVTPGEYTIKATAYDTIDQTDTHEIIVTVEDAFPTVEIILPTAAPLSGTVEITAAAADYRGIRSIDVFMDNELLTSWNEGPESTVDFKFNLDTTQYENGDHVLKAVASDTADQKKEEEITLSIQNPAGSQRGLF
jgi:hypothetical protein